MLVKAEVRRQMAEGYKEHNVAAFKELVNWLVFEAALHYFSRTFEITATKMS